MDGADFGGACMIVSRGRRRLALLFAVVLASLVAAAPAGAQDVKPVVAPNPDVGFIGIPESASAETGALFFDPENARRADKLVVDARNAAAACNKGAYDAALDAMHVWIKTLLEINSSAPYYPSAVPEYRLRGQRRSADIENLQRVRDQISPFPPNCVPPKYGTNRYGFFELYAIGGGMVPLNGTGAVTGVDTFFGPGAFLIDNKSGGTSNAAAELGVRVRASAQWNAFVEGVLNQAASINVGYVGSRSRSPQVFIESGVQTSFGAQSFIQPFSSVSATPQGFGSNTVKENFQIPILLGVGVPLTGIEQIPTFFDIYGGATISNSTQTLQGRELGAPAGSGFFAAQTRTTVDPTVGIGLRATFNNQSVGGFALPPIIIGANAELSFRPGGAVQAQSPNFPSESYYGTVDPRPIANFMFRVGFPLGGTH